MANPAFLSLAVLGAMVAAVVAVPGEIGRAHV